MTAGLRFAEPLFYCGIDFLRAFRAVVVESEIVPAGSCRYPSEDDVIVPHVPRPPGEMAQCTVTSSRTGLSGPVLEQPVRMVSRIAGIMYMIERISECKKYENS